MADTLGPKANVMDMNDDFVYGGPGDALVCDSKGGQWDGNTYTEDVDGDGNLEDQIFVDTASGQDVAGCGAPGSPCKSIPFAEQRADDGLADLGEPILCVTGVHSGTIKPTLFGLPTVKTKPADAAAGELASFEYPKDPAMIVSWDQDDDGDYRNNGFTTTDSNFGISLKGGIDYVEVVHVTIVDAGRQNHMGGGLIEWERRVGDSEYVRVAGINAPGVNRGNCFTNSNMTMNSHNMHVKWFSFEDSEYDAYGYGLWRGGPSGGHGVRIKNVRGDFRGLGKNTALDNFGEPCTLPNPDPMKPRLQNNGRQSGQSSGFRMWTGTSDMLENLQVANSSFEYVGAFDQSGNSLPVTGRGTGGSGGIFLTCYQDVFFSRVDWLNMGGLPGLTVGDHICAASAGTAARATRNLVFDRIYLGTTDDTLSENGFWAGGFATLWGNKNNDGDPSNAISGVIRIANSYIDIASFDRGGMNTNGILRDFSNNPNTGNVSNHNGLRWELENNIVVAPVGLDRQLIFNQQKDLGAGSTILLRNNVFALEGGGTANHSLAALGLTGLDPRSGGNTAYSCRDNPWGSVINCPVATLAIDPGRFHPRGLQPPPDPCATDPGSVTCCAANPGHPSCAQPTDPCDIDPGGEECCATNPGHESCNSPPNPCADNPGGEACCAANPGHESCSQPNPCEANPGSAECCAANPEHESCTTCPDPECPDPEPCPDCPEPPEVGVRCTTVYESIPGGLRTVTDCVTAPVAEGG